MFDKASIANSKNGTHSIVFQPGAKPKDCIVKKVRGDFVWVLVDGQSCRLNATASKMLIDGAFRAG